MQSESCFACEGPSATPPVETPGAWSTPRGLCLRHKRWTRVVDGELLHRVMSPAKPEGHPLEGSKLAWLYNPVTIVDYRGVTVRCWNDFAAGGRAVLEDRFDAATYFDFAACERWGAVDVLFALHESGAGALTPGELLEVALEARRIQPDAHSIDGPIVALEVLWEVFLCERAIAARRSETRRDWPASFAELKSWLTHEGPEFTRRGWQDCPEAGEFARRLLHLAEVRHGSRQARHPGLDCS